MVYIWGIDIAEALNWEHCTYFNCFKPHFGRGYCKQHYTNVRRHGIPETPTRQKPFKRCKSCDRIAVAKGLCHTHWAQNPKVKEKRRKYMSIWGSKNKEYKISYGKQWRKKNPNYDREWKRDNPRSNTRFPIELQIAMNNVRRRDNNTCQWYGCGLTHREAPIHVHHIFPRSEYPDLQLVEQYMICYCYNHHGLWHRYRGDDNPLVNLTKGVMN